MNGYESIESMESEENIESTGKYELKSAYIVENPFDINLNDNPELKSVYIVEDLFDINLNGNPECEIIGVFNSLEEAMIAINAQRWDNIKWFGDRKFKYTDSHDLIHIGFINKYPVGVII